MAARDGAATHNVNALATYQADRVLVFVREEDGTRYREDDVLGEAQRRFGVPVTEISR